jgi:ribonuclease HI
LALHNILNIDLWIQKQKTHTLYFDGASKGNPGEAGAGGILYDPGGKTTSRYHWNLGTETNNKVEAYTLLKGVQLAHSKEIRELVVLGDSNTIIRLMVKGTNPKDPSLKTNPGQNPTGLQRNQNHLLSHPSRQQ